MIEARAVVVRTLAATAWVRVDDRPVGCGRCSEPGGCGGARIAYAFGRPNEVFRIDDAGHFVPGDRVVLTIEDGAALGAALATYGVPTFGALLGTAVGAWMGNDTGAAIGLAAGLITAFVLARRGAATQSWQRRLSLSIRGDNSECINTARHA